MIEIMVGAAKVAMHEHAGEAFRPNFRLDTKPIECAGLVELVELRTSNPEDDRHFLGAE